VSDIWFTADLHLMHVLVSRLRGFASPEEHDAELARRWDERVRPQDTVKVLGDLCLGLGRPHGAALEWIAERPGTKDLVFGNHDAGHPMHAGAHKVQAEYLSVFRSAQQSAVIKVGRERIHLNHMPFAADHTVVARYPEWRPIDVGQWLLHGHTHSRDPGPIGRQIHVGLDAHDLRPVSLKWVREIMTCG
jgi:calcineurin-like phosphoesterase family protein